MNEQNISNIIEYLDQNPDHTTESLVINLLNEGYVVEDIKEALDRLGISPVVIPGYKETIVYSTPRKPYGKIALMALVIVGIIILIAVIFIVITYFSRTISNTTTPSTTNSSATTTETDPVTLMKQALEEGDYKVTINTNVYYVDNGLMVRKEISDGKIYLNWANVLTVLDVPSKTYKTYFSQAPEAIEFFNTQNSGLIPLELITETEAGKVSWKKTNDTLWESTNVPKQQITFDPMTKLVTKRAFINPDGTVSKEDYITYEKMTISQDILDIPTDYTQQTP